MCRLTCPYPSKELHQRLVNYCKKNNTTINKVIGLLIKNLVNGKIKLSEEKKNE